MRAQSMNSEELHENKMRIFINPKMSTERAKRNGVAYTGIARILSKKKVCFFPRDTHIAQQNQILNSLAVVFAFFLLRSGMAIFLFVCVGVCVCVVYTLCPKKVTRYLAIKH